MSAAPASDIKIYINLLDEGTAVMRPTFAANLGEGKYQVLPTADYDPENEHWEFPPGSIVHCVEETKENEKILVAKRLHK